MVPFVAGGACAFLVVGLTRFQPDASRPEPFGDAELSATDQAVASLWPSEPTFDWGPDDEGLGQRAMSRLVRLRAA
jgi:hypothetical protein